MHRLPSHLTTPLPTTPRGRITTLLILLLLLTLTLLCNPTPTPQHPTTGHHPYTKPPPPPPLHAPTPVPASPVPSAQKLLVKVCLEGEDVRLLKLLPEWRNEVITIERRFALLHPGARTVDMGRVADAYLRWIVENYANLAEMIVFVPPGVEGLELERGGNGGDQGVAGSINRLSGEWVQRSGFVPLRCRSVEECEDDAVAFRNPPDRYRTLEVTLEEVWVQMFNDTSVPETLASPGGSAFAVSKTQVLKRSVEEYKRYWEWLATTEMDDDSAGAVVERLWHVIFGKENVWCPGEMECV